MVKDKKIGEILIEKGLLAPEELDIALKEQVKTGEFLGALLLRKKLIKEGDLLAVLSEKFGIPFVNVKNKYINWKAVWEFSASLILDYRYFPIEKNANSVTIAVINPADMWALKKAEQEAGGLAVKLVLVSREDMDEIILRYKRYKKGRMTKLLEQSAERQAG